MSALDIAGAVASGVLFVVCWSVCLAPQKSGIDDDVQGFAFWVALVSTAWLAFCIARLCGASL